MKYRNEYFNAARKRKQEWKKEHRAGGFRCSHCKRWVPITDYMGTVNRNHCTVCLWSKHVDERKGDRKAECHGGMKPIGLTFKHEGVGRQGEIMLVHECATCFTLSINRIAGDDENDKIMAVFRESAWNQTLKNKLDSRGIVLLSIEDEQEVTVQLFGK